MLLFGIYVLCESPPAFALNEAFLPRLRPLLPKGLNPFLLVFPSYTKEIWRFALSARLRLRHFDLRRSRWMCCTDLEMRRLRSVGFAATVCHQNLFCDENIFVVHDGPKQWDAVYTAQIVSWKRIHLAAQVNSLRLITATPEKIHLLGRYGVSHANCNGGYLTKPEVSRAVGECRVGLALSAREGGMLACTEYLLCGLPVVTTPSIGGRDVWLNSSNSLTVAPDATAVAGAVRRLAEYPPDQTLIRNDAVARSRGFRATLADTVHALTGRRPFDPAQIDGGWFVKHFVPIHFLPEFLASHNGTRFERQDHLGHFL